MLLLQQVLTQNTQILDKLDDVSQRLSYIEGGKVDDRLDAVEEAVGKNAMRLTRMETILAPVTALGAALTTFFAQKLFHFS